jgi:hypothetical protein
MSLYVVEKRRPGVFRDGAIYRWTRRDLHPRVSRWVAVGPHYAAPVEAGPRNNAGRFLWSCHCSQWLIYVDHKDVSAAPSVECSQTCKKCASTVAHLTSAIGLAAARRQADLVVAHRVSSGAFHRAQITPYLPASAAPTLIPVQSAQASPPTNEVTPAAITTFRTCRVP